MFERLFLGTLKLLPPLLCLPLLLQAPYLMAHEIIWNGSTDDNWQIGTNWQPYTGCTGFCGLFPPGPNDTAVLSPTIWGSNAVLTGHVDVDAVNILNGMNVDANGFGMDVTTFLAIQGASSSLRVVDAGGTNPDFSLETLVIEQGSLRLAGSPQVEVTGASSYNFQGSILGNGSIRFRNLEGTPGRVLINDGSIIVRSADLTLTADNGGDLDLDGSSETGIIDVDDFDNVTSRNLTLTVDGQLYFDAFDSTMLVGKGDRVHFTQPWTFGNDIGGTPRIKMNARDSTATLSGADMTMDDPVARIEVNSGTARFDANLDIHRGTLVVSDNTTIDFAKDASFSIDARIDKSLASNHQMIVRGITEIRQPLFDWDGLGQDVTSIVGGFLDIFSNEVETGTNQFDGSLNIVADGNRNAVLRVGTPSPWVMNGMMHLDGTSTEAKVFNGSLMQMGNGVGEASLEVDGLQARIESPVEFRDDARITLNTGSRLTLTNTSVVADGTRFFGDGQFVNDGAMTVENGAVIDVELVNHGTLAMANHPSFGPVHVAAFEQTTAGQWNVRVRLGNSDQLQVAAAALLDGSLNIVSAMPTPSRGDAFTILTASSVSGEFASVGQGGVAPGDAWRVLYGPTSVILKVTSSADFNDDHSFDCLDVDALVAEIASGVNNVDFDLTGDGIVDGMDLDQWLIDAGAANLTSGNPYLPGDANLDGTVDGQDFILWNTHKFTSTAAWCSGDFNADGVVDGQDFITWNTNKFSSADSGSASSVPEPIGASWMLAGLLIGFRLRHHE